ncbi:MAG: hypothetical protein ACRES7_10625 [Gammaproteobacteria bacterium]
MKYLGPKKLNLSRNAALFACVSILCVACSSMNTPPAQQKPTQQNTTQQEPTPDNGQQLAILNHGYAMLYEKAQEFTKIHKLLYVKINTKAVGDFMDALDQYGDTMQKQLEKMVKQYPSLSLTDNGLPVIEVKKRAGVSHYYLMQMLPLVGRSGKDFDRTILQTQSEELNQARFYARALLDEERNSNRKQMLQGIQQHLDQLYNQALSLLQKNYYSS